MLNELIDGIINEVVFTTTRSGGPGGQNVNKVNSKVILKWKVNESRVLDEERRSHILTHLRNQLTADGTLIISSQATRSQLKNKDEAIAKLRLIIKKAFVVRKKRKPTKPSKASLKRRVDEKKRKGEKKEWRKKLR